MNKRDDLKSTVAQKGKQQRYGDYGRLLQRGVMPARIPAARAGSGCGQQQHSAGTAGSDASLSPFLTLGMIGKAAGFLLLGH